ncbi:MAG: DUF4382 domain-containing protein [Haloquadratum sp.]
MKHKGLASVLVAALVLFAGCSGGITGAPDGTATDGATATERPTATPTDGTDGGTGTLNLYVSDEKNAIDDFEHLNVTITRIGLKPAGDGAGGGESDGNETDTADGNATAGSAETADGNGEWVEYAVDNRTVDLTRLQGANATKLASFNVSNGTYEKVFVYVSDVRGTLADGSDQRVTLPSGKLQLNTEFTVGNGEAVDFVFDITVVKAGKSGKYILTPVISESGTDVEIDPVGGPGERGPPSETQGAPGDRSGNRTAALNATFVGNVTAGENATLRVTQNGSAVANATVALDGRTVGTTDAQGELSLSVPENADEITVSVTRGEAEVELEVDLGTESTSSAGNGRSTIVN